MSPPAAFEIVEKLSAQVYDFCTNMYTEHLSFLKNKIMPVSTKAIATRLTHEDVNSLQDAAQAANMTRTALMREIIRRHLSDTKAEPPAA